MSARVVFFASIREQLGTGGIEVDVPSGCRVSGLIDQLVEDNDPAWRNALTAENTRIAINQELVSGDEIISDGDEIAFFPPVTGG